MYSSLTGAPAASSDHVASPYWTASPVVSSMSPKQSVPMTVEAPPQREESPEGRLRAAAGRRAVVGGGGKGRPQDDMVLCDGGGNLDNLRGPKRAMHADPVEGKGSSLGIPSTEAAMKMARSQPQSQPHRFAHDVTASAPRHRPLGNEYESQISSHDGGYFRETPNTPLTARPESGGGSNSRSRGPFSARDYDADDIRGSDSKRSNAAQIKTASTNSSSAAHTSTTAFSASLRPSVALGIDSSSNRSHNGGSYSDSRSPYSVSRSPYSHIMSPGIQKRYRYMDPGPGEEETQSSKKSMKTLELLDKKLAPLKEQRERERIQGA